MNHVNPLTKITADKKRVRREVRQLLGDVPDSERCGAVDDETRAARHPMAHKQHHRLIQNLALPREAEGVGAGEQEAARLDLLDLIRPRAVAQVVSLLERGALHLLLQLLADGVNTAEVAVAATIHPRELDVHPLQEVHDLLPQALIELERDPRGGPRGQHEGDDGRAAPAERETLLLRASGGGRLPPRSPQHGRTGKRARPGGEGRGRLHEEDGQGERWDP
mmetsp:Transcript_61698/g.151870  ORF Transcript_61698/g.151870 Transcript_61698/m.151870 type:complete len:222 (+) Transcript_61698:1064-1729(+)